MDLCLRAVTNADLPLIGRWLRADHVRSAWGDPDTNLKLLRDRRSQGNGQGIIKVDGRKVGLVLWQHPTRQELDDAGLTDIPDSVIDIDIMIGARTQMGRGVGSAALGRVAQAALSNSTVPFVIAATGVDNLASQRAFAKAGFRPDRTFDDGPNGRYVLMVRHRQKEAA